MSQLTQIIGAAGILLAFVAAQAGRLALTSASYLALNTVGAGLLTASAVHEEQWGFAVLEGVWTAVALAGLVRRWQRGGASPS